MKTPFLVLLSLLFFAPPARAVKVIVDELIDGQFQATDAGESQITCTVIGEGDSFSAQAQISGLDAHGFGSLLVFNTHQPTAVMRTEKKLSVRQSEWAGVLFSSEDVTQLSGIMPQCMGNAALIAPAHRITAFFSCKGDDLSVLMSDDGIANLAATVAGSKHAKFHTDAHHKKWQLSLACDGPFEPI
jgi:hypothetical protein